MFLKETYSQPLQIQADRLDRCFKKSRSKEICFKRKKKVAIALHIKDPIKKEKKLNKAENFGLPKFKAKSRHEDSIFYPQNFVINDETIYFPKIGDIKYIQHIPLQGIPKNVTIKQDGKFWNCSVCCEIEINNIQFVPLEQANVVGIDVGIKNFAVFSDGVVIENPKFLKKFEKRIKIEQGKLSRKELKVEKDKNGKEYKISSKNREKQLIKVQNKYRDLRNSRKNFLHQLTHWMITKYDGFCVESLSINNMIKEAKEENKKYFVKSLYDVSWGEFFRILEYKSLWNSKYFQEIDQFFASTQTCPFCGHVQKEITLADRVLICPNCKNVMDRDLRSSKMTQIEGLRLLKEPQELKAVGETVSDGFVEAATSENTELVENALAFATSEVE